MEVTINALRAGLSPELLRDVKRLAPPQLLAHNIERMLVIYQDGSESGLGAGDVIVHRDSASTDRSNLGVVMDVDKDGVTIRSLHDDGEDLVPDCFADIIVVKLADRELRDELEEIREGI